MNCYDFDKTIYNGDSTKDFYLFCLKRHKGIIKTFPGLIKAFTKFYVLKKGNKTDFKEKMYRFLPYVNIEKDLPEFWASHKNNIKDWYYKTQREDDVIISASPEFLLEPICKELGIKYLMASKVDMKTGKYEGINCHGKEKVRRFMNCYDFDKTIYNGDSTKDFYLFCLKRHKGIIKTFPGLIKAFTKFYVLKKGNKTDFKEKMYRFLPYVNIEKDLPEFWASHKNNIKDWYYKTQREDDVIISASPEFLLEPICKELGIKYLMASKVDMKTGKYEGINCHGKEKVRRFYEMFPNGKIEDFYSDSYSDSPLAEISKKAFLVKGDELKDW